MNARYEVKEGHLFIDDDELEIHLHSPFSYSQLPSELKPSQAFQVDYDKEGKAERAYCVQGDVWHGQCKLFYPSGKVKAEMTYHQNQLHGPSTFFSEQGNILSQSWFYFGEQMGKMTQYYAEGPLYSVQRFKEGKLHGKQEYFYEDGSVKTLMHYHMGGLHGEVKLYWPDHRLKREITFVHHKRQGWDRMWNEQGVAVDEGEYDQGQPIGKHILRFANGKPKEELIYHTPTRFDKREWTEEGLLIFEGIYSADLSYVEKKFDAETKVMKERHGFWDGEKLCWK